MTARSIPNVTQNLVFDCAEGAPSHPARPGPRFSIVTGAGLDANLPPSALSNSQILNHVRYKIF